MDFKQSEKVNVSLLCSEFMVFANAIDMAYFIKFELQLIAGSFIPLTMATNTFSLFDILTRASTTTEKRLKIDLRNVLSTCEKMEIEDVTYIKSKLDIADALTQTKADGILLKSILVLGNPRQRRNALETSLIQLSRRRSDNKLH